MTTEEELRRAYLTEQNLREYNRRKSALNRANNIVSKARQLKGTYNKLMNSGNNISSLGKNMSNIGTQLQKSSNPYLNALGNKLGNAGTNTQNFGNNLQNNINTKFNVNNTPAPNSSNVAVQQQPTSLFGKMQSGLNQNTMGLTDPKSAQTAANSLPSQQYQQMGNQLMGKVGLGGISNPGNMGALNSGMAGGAGNSAIGGAINSNISSGIGSSIGSTTGTNAGIMGANASSALGGTAGSTGTIGSAIGSNVAGTAGSTAGTSAVGGAISSAAPSAASSAGAGLGSSAAAGGGAAAAGSAASVVPVIGWAIAAASLIANMFNAKRKEQQAKAMQASMQATADNESESEKEGQEAMQNIANQNNQFQNGTLGMQPTTQDAKDMKVAELMAMLNGGQMTGGASGVDQQQIANILASTMQDQNNQQTQQGVPTGNAVPITQQQANQVMQQQPVQQGTTTGQASPIAVQQLNGSVSQTQQAPQFGDQVYQTNNGTGRLAQVFDQIRQGYKDNTENTLGNTYFAPNQQKTFANRLGEFVGTGQRIASNPIVQGLVAGGVNYANGGNFGNSALTGINWAREKANSDRYEQLINGGNKRSFMGGYTAQDYNTKLAQDYKNQQQQNWAQEQQDKKDRDERDYNYKVQKDTKDFEYRKSKDDRDYKLKVEEKELKRKGVGGYGNKSTRIYGNSGSKGESVAQQKFNYQREFNSNVGKFDKYAKNLAKAQEAVEKAGWKPGAKAQAEAQLNNAQAQYDKAREAMLSQYGADFLKYEKDMNK